MSPQASVLKAWFPVGGGIGRWYASPPPSAFWPPLAQSYDILTCLRSKGMDTDDLELKPLKAQAKINPSSLMLCQVFCHSDKNTNTSCFPFSTIFVEYLLL